MKTKFFIIGFVTALIFAFLSALCAYKYAKNSQIDSLQKELSKENNSITIEIEPYEDKKDFLFNNSKSEEIFSVKSDNNNLIFINFWATWCAPCIAEMPSFEKLILEEPLKNEVTFIFASKENNNKITSFYKKNKFQLPIYQFKENDNSIFNHKSIPTTYIINKKQKLIYKISGSYNWTSELLNNFLKNIKT